MRSPATGLEQIKDHANEHGGAHDPNHGLGCVQQPRLCKRIVLRDQQGEEDHCEEAGQQRDLRRLRYTSSETAQLGEGLDLARAEGLERRAALQHGRVTVHHLERLGLTHSGQQHAAALKNRVGEGVRRVDDLWVDSDGCQRALLGAVALKQRTPQVLQISRRVLLLEGLCHLKHFRRETHALHFQGLILFHGLHGLHLVATL
mmetsp:Transcript_14800/g.29972  ORF Transcript_14800/g.29972 Transcript_14800/m.29972 type:complete len:203 (-) Transcript_14800:320-928(-)